MGGTTFAYPWVLLGLILIPLLAVWRFWPSIRRRHVGTFLFSQFQLLAKHPRTWRTVLLPLPDILLLVALGLAIVGLARPQAILAEEVEVEGIDIYLALDMSGSMRAIDQDLDGVRRLANQGRRPQNRFEYAVDTLKDFVKSRAFDRIGMVVFAKDAYLQFPLTLDYNTILGMLDRLRLGDIDEGGTAIGNALGRAIAGLKDSEAKTRIVILITDGDRRGGNISPRQAAKIAADTGIKIFPILVGREGPTLVPAGRNFLTGQFSYQQREYPINPELLREIASTTDGEYFRVTDAEGLREGLHQILDRFERSRVQDNTSVDYRELYHQWVLWALLLVAFQSVLRHTLLRKFP